MKLRLFLISAVMGFILGEKVIYGDDDRKDIYDVQDAD